MAPLGFWVHCNDSKLSVCTSADVCRAQAYILFYTQRGPESGYLECPADGQHPGDQDRDGMDPPASDSCS